MHATNKFSVLFVGSLMLLAAFSPAMAILSLAMNPMAPGMNIAGVNSNQAYSTNWCGYAVTASKGAVTKVQGS
jgi:hypothetical protein